MPHPLVLCIIAWMIFGNSNITQANSPITVHHQLSVELQPDSHKLKGHDVITFPSNHRGSSPLTFMLNKNLEIGPVTIQDRSLPPSHLSIQGSSHQQIVSLILPEEHDSSHPLTISFAFQGLIDDTPKASKGLRFVRPDKTTGHIGSNGIYLTYESFWFPTIPETFSTFNLTVDLPEDYHPITQGQEVTHMVKDGRRRSEWKIDRPSEALTLAANRFVIQEQNWKGIRLATYLFPSEAPLAQQYLDATVKYLDLYTRLLGPYPFQQFAVVENFFPSGLGLPSFTLLGQGVVRRGYTQPYSLGHEIVHSWLGNSVLNDLDQGNWVEGLTTYLSNYYYDEAMGNHEAALKTRKRMMDEYNLYATPEKEYPIKEFHHKETRLDNAIGYQKTALVFHMLRQELGDESFFLGIRGLIKDGTGKYLGWNDLERIFSHVGEKELSWFFHQWVNRQGAPSLTIQDVIVRESRTLSGQFRLSATLNQTGPVQRFQIPLRIHMEGGTTHTSKVSITKGTHTLDWTLPSRPVSLSLDPEYDFLLRLQRNQMAPMLNAWDTDRRRMLVLPKTISKEDEEAYSAPLRRLKQQTNLEIMNADEPDVSQPASYLVFGSPARHLVESRTLTACHPYVRVEEDRVIIQDQTYMDPHMAFLISCPHPLASEHVVTLFFGLSPEAVKAMARLLFFYGWDSYLVYKKGRVIARGMFPSVHSARTMTIPWS